MIDKSGPICQAKATRCMKMPLRSTEQIYLVFLIPTLINCFVYILNLAADLVVAEQHLRHENPIWSGCTIGLLYAPALAYFVLTVSRPDWYMSQDDETSIGIFGWLALQICRMIAFPLFALYRYAGLIVLSVDAIMLSGTERRKTLDIAAKPAAIELYFFLQAWFQAAPQAIFQTHLLFREQSVPRSYQSLLVQILSIVMSIVVLAIQTTSFQRFESQRLYGRKLPWALWLKKYRDQELKDMQEKQRAEAVTLIDPNVNDANDQNAGADIEAANEQSSDDIKTDVGYNRQISDPPPLPPKNAHPTPPATPLRGITVVTTLQVPDMPAPPRPDSIGVESRTSNSIEPSDDADVEGSTKAPARSESLRLPKRRYSQKGLEEDDPIGRAIAFLWWFLFILPRVLSIAVFYEFYPGYLFIVLGIHYLTVILYLFYNAKYYTVTTCFINLWLGFVYIFSAIEYKVKFKYADRWLYGYYTFVMVQNTVLTLSWYFYADWDSFWYQFVFYVAFASMGLCVLSTSVWHLLLKPRTQRVYTEDS